MSVTVKTEPISGNAFKLYLEGDITIYTVNELKEQLVEDINDYNSLEIDLKSVAKMDTSGYQLFLFLKNEASRLGKKISIMNPSAEAARIFELYNTEL